MARRRKKSSVTNLILLIIIFALVGLLIFKIYDNHKKPIDNEPTQIDKTNKDDNKQNKKDDDKKDEPKKTTDDNKKEENKTGPKSTEEDENKYENDKKKNLDITLELIGDDEVVISVGEEYKDKGCKATYSDGSDASSEVSVENAVDTSKKGIYTVTYSVGNNIIIRRVEVK